MEGHHFRSSQSWTESKWGYRFKIRAGSSDSETPKSIFTKNHEDQDDISWTCQDFTEMKR
jgi:hypothetical protein